MHLQNQASKRKIPIETNLEYNSGNFNVSGVHCSQGYKGKVVINKCTAPGKSYNITGCEKIPLCKSYSNNHGPAGYNLTNVVETSLQMDSTFQVSGISCLKPHYYGSVSASKCLSKNTNYVLSGCNEAICTRPTTPGYDFSKVQENDLNVTSFSVTGITCSEGYGAGSGITVSASPCDLNNGKYKVTGCNILKCRSPSINMNWKQRLSPYDFSAVKETDLTYLSFNVTNIKCASGYVGTPIISPCPILQYSTMPYYNVSGCQLKFKNSMCQRPSLAPYGYNIVEKKLNKWSFRCFRFLWPKV